MKKCARIVCDTGAVRSKWIVECGVFEERITAAAMPERCPFCGASFSAPQRFKWPDPLADVETAAVVVVALGLLAIAIFAG